MLYSASRRTDMPAFHPDVIVERVSRSRRLEGLVLWTKDIRNLAFHHELRGVVENVPTVVQYTVTGLAGGDWEPRVPPLLEQLPALREVARMLPPGAVCWRFDPIIPGLDLWRRFREVKKHLEECLGALDGVTTSFADPYRKAVTRSRQAGLEWPAVDRAAKERIIAMMAGEFARKWSPPRPGFRPVRLCCEPELLTLPGVGMAHCIDGGLFERLYGLPLGDLAKDSGQRLACGCVKSTEIGSYDMICGHGCLYCYANPDIYNEQ